MVVYILGSPEVRKDGTHVLVVAMSTSRWAIIAAHLSLNSMVALDAETPLVIWLNEIKR